MQTFLQDLRYGARMLRQTPGFTLVVLVTLALGIGANSAIFSVVNAVMLRPLPYDRPEQLVSVYDSLPSIGFARAGLSEAEFIRLRDEARAFSQVATWNWASFTLTGAGEPERVPAAVSSANFFNVLGVNVALGRNFRPEEELAGKSNVVVLSHGFWQRRFAANPNVIGQALTLNGQSYTVIGVLPAKFKAPPELQAAVKIELWAAYGFDLAGLNRGSHPLAVIGRLGPGVKIEQALADTSTIIARVVKDHPNFYPSDGSFRSFLVPLHTDVVGDVRRALLVLLGAVAVVLLIACANVANLLLARSESRQKEVAVRLALGAGRWRVVRQLLSESLLLAFLGGAVGLLLARWGLDAIIALSPDNIPRLADTSLDVRVAGFTLLVSLLTGIVFGLAPALQAVKFDLHSTLKEGGRTSGSPAGRSRLRQSLVVLETAMALVLLISAGLLTRSFWHLQRVNTGFNPERLLTMRLAPPASAYKDNQQVAGLYERLIEKVQTLPGVQSVAVADPLPLSNSSSDTIMQIEGRPFDMNRLNLMSTDLRVVSPAYFQTMGIRLLKGRLFADSDQEGAQPVTIINETLARNHWPGEDPIGRRLRPLDAPPEQATSRYVTIIGVVADAKNRALNAEARQELYFPLRQHAATFGGMGLQQAFNLVVRTAADPLSLSNTIRQEVLAIDRSIPITQVRTMEQMIEAAVVQPRFNMILLGIFAAVALGLGAVGIYGVIAYTVARRTHEIGIRMALGAERRDVLRLVIGQGMWLVLAGTGMGLAASFGLMRLVKDLLYGVSATDPITFVAISLLLIIVALLACYIPARRATKVDPMIALRYE